MSPEKVADQLADRVAPRPHFSSPSPWWPETLGVHHRCQDALTQAGPPPAGTELLDEVAKLRGEPVAEGAC